MLSLVSMTFAVHSTWASLGHGNWDKPGEPTARGGEIAAESAWIERDERGQLDRARCARRPQRSAQPDPL